MPRNLGRFVLQGCGAATWVLVAAAASPAQVFYLPVQPVPVLVPAPQPQAQPAQPPAAQPPVRVERFYFRGRRPADLRSFYPSDETAASLPTGTVIIREFYYLGDEEEPAAVTVQPGPEAQVELQPEKKLDQLADPEEMGVEGGSATPENSTQNDPKAAEGSPPRGNGVGAETEVTPPNRLPNAVRAADESRATEGQPAAPKEPAPDAKEATEDGT